MRTYTWDADGNSVTIGSVGLTFDALDRMVEQNRSGSYTQVVYGPQGNKLALMNGPTLAKGFVPLSAGATAVYTWNGSSTVLGYYRHSDGLGSSRLASTPGQALYYDGAYAPFGENYAETGATDRNFTGQNQDTVSTGAYPLYDFLYREYHPTWGRWVSPDPAGLAAADPSNPQTWNRYAYVTNDPLALVDPLGLDEGDCADPDYADSHPECSSPGCSVFGCTCNPFDPLCGVSTTAGGGGSPTPPAIPTPPNSDFPNGSMVCGKVIYPGVPPDPTCIQTTWSQDWLAIFGVSWPAAFLSDLLSVRATISTTYKSATSSNGCIAIFATSAALSFVPTGSPSLSDAVPAAAGYLKVSNAARAIAYAGSRTNYLGGTGLIYPLKSRVVQSILGRGSSFINNAPAIQVDTALFQGVATEGIAAYNGACQ